MLTENVRDLPALAKVQVWTLAGPQGILDRQAEPRRERGAA